MPGFAESAVDVVPGIDTQQTASGKTVLSGTGETVPEINESSSGVEESSAFGPGSGQPQFDSRFGGTDLAEDSTASPSGAPDVRQVGSLQERVDQMSQNGQLDVGDLTNQRNSNLSGSTSVTTTQAQQRQSLETPDIQQRDFGDDIVPASVERNIDTIGDVVAGVGESIGGSVGDVVGGGGEAVLDIAGEEQLGDVVDAGTEQAGRGVGSLIATPVDVASGIVEGGEALGAIGREAAAGDFEGAAATTEQVIQQTPVLATQAVRSAKQRPFFTAGTLFGGAAGSVGASRAFSATGGVSGAGTRISSVARRAGRLDTPGDFGNGRIRRFASDTRGQGNLGQFKQPDADTDVELSADDLVDESARSELPDAVEQRAQQLEIKADRRIRRRDELTPDEPVDPDVRTVDSSPEGSGRTVSRRETTTVSKEPDTKPPADMSGRGGLDTDLSPLESRLAGDIRLKTPDADLRDIDATRRATPDQDLRQSSTALNDALGRLREAESPQARVGDVTAGAAGLAAGVGRAAADSTADVATISELNPTAQTPSVDIDSGVGVGVGGRVDAGTFSGVRPTTDTDTDTVSQSRSDSAVDAAQRTDVAARESADAMSDVESDVAAATGGTGTPTTNTGTTGPTRSSPTGQTDPGGLSESTTATRTNPRPRLPELDLDTDSKKRDDIEFGVFERFTETDVASPEEILDGVEDL